LEALAGPCLQFDGQTKHVFAKPEALLKEHNSQPRIVYQGTDLYNALTGAVVWKLAAVMHQVFGLENPLNTGNKVIFACGMGGDQLGDLIQNAKGDPVESDMKNNDASQPGAWRKYEAMFYKKLGAPDWFVREFAKNTSIRVWTRYGVEATVKGQRWSGESTTTTGNSYVSMAQVLRALERAEIVESTNIHGGDDYLGIAVDPKGQLPQAIVDTVAAGPMKAEVVVPKSKHHATFYRKRYVESEIGRRPVPQFGRVLAKLNVRANLNAEVNDKDYMAGKYASAAYEHRHVPVIRDILLNVSRTLSDKPYFDDREARKFKDIKGGFVNVCEVAEKAPVHDEGTMSSFCEDVYGHGFFDIVDLYSYIAQSCIDYCNGWTFVDKKKCIRNKANSSDYVPPKLAGVVVDSLVAADT